MRLAMTGSAVGERLDQRARQRLVGKARQHEVGGAAHARLHLGLADAAEQADARMPGEARFFRAGADHVDARAGIEIERLGQRAEAALDRQAADEQAPCDHRYARSCPAVQRRRVRYSIFGVRRGFSSEHGDADLPRLLRLFAPLCFWGARGLLVLVLSCSRAPRPRRRPEA